MKVKLVLLVDLNWNKAEGWNIKETTLRQFHFRNDTKRHEAQSHDRIDVVSNSCCLRLTFMMSSSLFLTAPTGKPVGFTPQFITHSPL
jgi:hypothetical protein